MIAMKLGWGVGPVVNRPMRVMFDDDTGIQTGWFSRLSQNVSHKISLYSGDAHTNAFFQAKGVVAAQERFHDIMLSGKPLGYRFLRDYGLSEADAGSIRAEYLKHHKVDKELGGVFTPGLDKWGNRKAAALYQSAIDQAAAKSLNLVDRSKKPAVLANSLMAPVTSLRTWAMSAFDNYTLRYFSQLHDKEGFGGRAAVAIATGSAAAALLYTVRTYVTSIGRPDQKEYLERMLSDKNIALAAIGKAQWSSLMPMPVDFAFSWMHKDPPFAKTRVSQAGNQANPWATITSTPLGSWIYDATRASSMPFRAMFDTDYTPNQADMRSLYNSVFWPNILNSRNFLQYTYDDLPRTEKSTRKSPMDKDESTLLEIIK
jgi:hypothetical protein